MNGYNDYVNATRHYLKHYSQFEIAIENARKSIAELEKELMPCAPIGSYGHVIHGNEELTTVEKNVSERIKKKAKIKTLSDNICKITLLLENLNRSIDSLDSDERILVNSVYKENKSWELISRENFITEKWAREKVNRAVRKIAIMMFGMDAVPYDVNTYKFLR